MEYLRFYILFLVVHNMYLIVNRRDEAYAVRLMVECRAA